MEFSELLPAKEQHVTRLTKLLQSLCEDEKAVQEALLQIVRESEMLESDVAMRVGGARREIRALIDSLQKSSTLLEFNHPLALQALCAAWRHPIGVAKSQIAELIDAANAALALLEDNQPDYGRRDFAYQIAKILQNMLEIRPVVSQCHPDIINGKRGGAAYERVLRESMRLAGIMPPTDLRDLMRTGLRLLNGDARGDQV